MDSQQAPNGQYADQSMLEWGGEPVDEDFAQVWEPEPEPNLRQRQPPPPVQSSGPPPLPPEPWIETARKSVKRWRQRWKARREIFWLQYEDKYEVRVNKCLAWTKTVVAAIASLCVLCMLIAYGWAYTSPEDAVLSEGRVYVYDGQEGVDLRAHSAPFTCQELQAGVYDDNLAVASLEAKSEAVLLQEDPGVPCLCAPMFGIRRQHMCLRGGNDTVLHLYNAVPDEDWTGLTELPRAERKSLVRQGQPQLFPRMHDKHVKVVRDNAMRLIYMDATCQHRALVARLNLAWCIQACMDLFVGVSVYDKAATVGAPTAQ